MRKRKPFPEYLVRNDANGCLEWTGGKDKDGYGVLTVSIYGESRAHRHAYKVANGPIPTGMIVRHTCDNPPCCDPEHLVLGTHLDNMADMASRNRAAKGANGGNAKLTDEMVLEIRRLYAEGLTQVELAKRFPVTQSSISLIVLRRQWTHI